METYIVKSGDNLWDIARAKLGRGSQWPRLWRYNNRRDIIRITGRGIPNPDLIYPGQKLLIPTVPGLDDRSGAEITSSLQAPMVFFSAPNVSPKTSTPSAIAAGSGPLSQQLPKLKSPFAVKYKLDDLTFPPIETPQVRIEYKITGDIALLSKKPIAGTYVVDSGSIEQNITLQANNAFGSLINQLTFNFDPKENALTLKAMFISQGNFPGAAATAAGVVIDARTGAPKLRFEYRMPKIEGSVQGFDYVGLDIKIVVELTVKQELPPANPVPVRQEAGRREQNNSINWGKVAAIGLLAGATVIVVGTVVEDFLSGGAGIVDDPASFAAAGGLFARAMIILRGAQASVVLPRAAAAAMISITVVVKATDGSANGASGAVKQLVSK